MTEREQKKSKYTRPKLTVYGDFARLTANGSGTISEFRQTGPQTFS